MPDPLRKTLSATETPALFGASPYTTRWMLLQRFIHGRDIDSPEHNRMDWGKKLQPLILQAAAEEVHLQIQANEIDLYVRNSVPPQHFLGCTRDAQIYCPDRGHGTVEAKAVFDYEVWMSKWEGGKRPPRHIEIQTQQQMLVGDGKTSFTWGLIAVWVCGDMHYFERRPIHELWNTIVVEAAKFFEDVAAGNEGSPFGETVELPLLNELYPPIEGKVIDLTTRPDAEELTNQVKLLKHHSELANSNEGEARRIKAKMLALMEDAEKATLLGGVEVRATLVRKKGHTVAPHSYRLVKTFVPSGDVPLAPTGGTE